MSTLTGRLTSHATSSTPHAEVRATRALLRPACKMSPMPATRRSGTVYYEGRYRPFWRPTVAAGWAPFTAGRWSAYYGDQCWIPYEPFGYVTHHNGNWVYAGNFWYWAPPVVSVQVGIGPMLGLGFGWYPGRVGWIHSGVNIGWIPLAPFEPYYCHRRWGPRTVVVWLCSPRAKTPLPQAIGAGSVSEPFRRSRQRTITEITNTTETSSRIPARPWEQHVMHNYYTSGASRVTTPGAKY